jgi:hypothetical protein
MTSLDLDNDGHSNGYNNSSYDYDSAAVASAAVTGEARHWWEEEGAGLHPGSHLGASSSARQQQQQQQGYAALLMRPIDRTARGDPAKLRYTDTYS